MKIAKEAYSEVYAIINLMSSNLIKKIPENVLKKIDDNRDKYMNIEDIDIDQYSFSDEANQLLAVLYKNYFATDEEKVIIKAKEQSIFQKEQKMLKEKYNPDNLFKNNTQNLIEETVKKENSFVEDNEALFKKTCNKLFGMFKR